MIKYLSELYDRINQHIIEITFSGILGLIIITVFLSGFLLGYYVGVDRFLPFRCLP